MALQYISDDKGKHTAVIIPISGWENITSKHQDLQELMAEKIAPVNNASRFKGILTDEEADKYRQHLKKPVTNGNGYLIDSNVIIDYTNSRLPEKGSDFVENLFNTDFLISVAVKIEVLGFADVPDKLSIMEEFINSATLLSLDDSVTNQAIILRRNYKKLKLEDAIIAATAIVYNLTLISHNIKDFVNIKGLSVLDPFKI